MVNVLESSTFTVLCDRSVLLVLGGGPWGGLQILLEGLPKTWALAPMGLLFPACARPGRSQTCAPA